MTYNIYVVQEESVELVEIVNEDQQQVESRTEYNVLQPLVDAGYTLQYQAGKYWWMMCTPYSIRQVSTGGCWVHPTISGR